MRGRRVKAVIALDSRSNGRGSSSGQCLRLRRFSWIRTTIRILLVVVNGIFSIGVRTPNSGVCQCLCRHGGSYSTSPVDESITCAGYYGCRQSRTIRNSLGSRSFGRVLGRPRSRAILTGSGYFSSISKYPSEVITIDGKLCKVGHITCRHSSRCDFFATGSSRVPSVECITCFGSGWQSTDTCSRFYIYHLCIFITAVGLCIKRRHILERRFCKMRIVGCSGRSQCRQRRNQRAAISRGPTVKDVGSSSGTCFGRRVTFIDRRFACFLIAGLQLRFAVLEGNGVCLCHFVFVVRTVRVGLEKCYHLFWRNSVGREVSIMAVVAGIDFDVLRQSSIIYREDRAGTCRLKVSTVDGAFWCCCCSSIAFRSGFRFSSRYYHPVSSCRFSGCVKHTAIDGCRSGISIVSGIVRSIRCIRRCNRS